MSSKTMRVLEPGHVYELKNQDGPGFQTLTFVRRSSGAITYERQWPGLQTQTVLRALIDRTKFLNSILACNETESALWHLRMALFEYEARAWRRKQEKANKTSLAHNDNERPRVWRTRPYNDVPFGPEDIELLPIGEDGHVIAKE